MSETGQPQEEWVCPECERAELVSEPGTRCPDHPESVLFPRPLLERFAGDRVLGQVVAGKYAVYGVLGMGGFGAVYRAIQEPVGRPVALKVVHAQHAGDAELRARFFREAKLVARLKSPVVVTLHDYGEVPEQGLYMVFELVEGHTLTQLVREGPQDSVRVANILLQLLSALSEAHAAGMVHRDLKPGNVMLVGRSDGDERVRLLDFGIAKVVTKQNQDNTLETQRGLVMGTPRYLSPEQARATGEIDLRSDLYSLAVIGYSLLAGTNPFERASIVDTILAHCHQSPPPLDPSLGVMPALEAALLRALEKDPADRFQSAEEMAETIEMALPHFAFPARSWRVRPRSVFPGEVDPTTGTPLGTTPMGGTQKPSVATQSSQGRTPADPSMSARPLADPIHPMNTWTGVHGAAAQPGGRVSRFTPLAIGLFLVFLVGTGLGLLWVRTPGFVASPVGDRSEPAVGRVPAVHAGTSPLEKSTPPPEPLPLAVDESPSDFASSKPVEVPKEPKKPVDGKEVLTDDARRPKRGPLDSVRRKVESEELSKPHPRRPQPKLKVPEF